MQKEWTYLNNGLPLKEIIKKKELKKRESLIGIERIIEEIEKLNDFERLNIDSRQQILPNKDNGQVLSSKAFRKRAKTINLLPEIIREDANSEHPKNPQELFIEQLKRKKDKYTFSDETYDEFATRGFKWYDTNSNHKVMPQTDILKAFVLSALITHYDMKGIIGLKYSNPGNIFNITIPTKENPEEFYKVVVQNLITEPMKLDEEAYRDWVNVYAQVNSIYPNNFNLGIYGESKRTKNPELIFNHTGLTAIILRNWFLDDKKEERGFKSEKSKTRDKPKGHPIYPVLLNFIPLPTEDLIEFYLKLNNNILIKNGNTYSKLTEAEKEALISVRNILYWKNSYYSDPKFKSLDNLLSLILTRDSTYTEILL